MLTSIEGIYRDGQVELVEKPVGVNEARVIVTFLPASGVIDLRERGISEEEARELRWRFQSFAEDWERPEMDVYNADIERQLEHHLAETGRDSPADHSPMA